MVDGVGQLQRGFLLRLPSSKDLQEHRYRPWVDLPVLGDSWDFGRRHRAQGHEVRIARTTEDALAALSAARGYPGGLHLRGAGHSMNGQTLPTRGIQLALSFEHDENDFQMDDRFRVTVPGSASWESVLAALEPQGRTIGVVTDHFETTVGGTLSVSGFGPSSLRFGRQVDLVDSLQVILPDERVIWCDSNTHSDIFRATLAGLGGIGIIRKARVRTTNHFPYVVTAVQLHSRWQDAIEHSDWLAKNIGGMPHNLGQHHYGMGPAEEPADLNVASTHTFEFRTEEEALSFATDGIGDIPDLGQGWSFLRVESRANNRLSFRSSINALLQQRWGDAADSFVQLWQDFVFPDVGLAQRFFSEVERDLTSPTLKETNFARYGCLINNMPSTPHLPLSFYAPGAAATNGCHASQGFYFAVRQDRVDDVAQATSFLSRATEITFGLGGRPYLYGWSDMDGAGMQSHYGESWDFYTRVKQSVDPDGILNKGFFSRLGL